MIDDDEIALKIMGNLLESQNHLVLKANAGETALQLVHREKPDLVITNLRTPQIDGNKIIRALKKRLSTRFIPILILIEEGQADVHPDQNHSGIDNYLIKPIDPKLFLDSVECLVN